MAQANDLVKPIKKESAKEKERYAREMLAWIEAHWRDYHQQMADGYANFMAHQTKLAA